MLLYSLCDHSSVRHQYWIKRDGGWESNWCHDRHESRSDLSGFSPVVLSNAVECFGLPIFVILQAAPMAAVVPLVTYIYGIGLTSKFLAAPVIVMNSYKGIRNTNPSLIQMCRAFLGTKTQVVMKIILPHTAAMIFTGLRLGLAMGFIGVVIAELLITPTGIGDLITYHSSVADFPEMFAAVGSIILIAAVAIHALERLERRLFPHEVRG